MARLDPLKKCEIDETYHDLIESQSPAPPEEYSHLAFAREHRIFRTLAYNPQMLQSFRGTINDLWDGTGLTPIQREVVILAVVRERETEYIWHHHVRGGVTIGMSPDIIRSIAESRFEDLAGPTGLLCRYSRAVAAERVDDEIWQELVGEFDPETIVGITYLASFYVMVGTFLDAFDVELEGSFVGWQLENL